MRTSRSTVTEPLRAEHRELLPRIDEIRDTADAVGVVTPAELRERVEATVEFLTAHLIPHAKAEDTVLYPIVAKLLDDPQATAAMTMDHVEVGQLTEVLRTAVHDLDGRQPTPTLLVQLRQVLYGLHALIRLHFAKEEEIYLPLLDAGLSPEQAAVMFDEMERVAKESAR